VKRKICIVTGSRAEFGQLSVLLDEIIAQPDMQAMLIVTGSHLAPSFGSTRSEIVASGYTIDAEVEMLLASDTASGMSKSIGLGIIGFTDALEHLKPDIVVVLGDRFEIFAATTAAISLGVPVAHLHGGEVSEGLVDEFFRHAITKLSQLHFVAAEPYRQRVVQMGEHPSRVFLVGALGADAILRTSLLDRASFEIAMDFRLRDRLILVTYHPETATGADARVAITELVAALESFDDASIIVTGVNADAGHDVIQNMLRAFAERHAGRVLMRNSLGHRLYISAMALADVVVGNSSSGIIEAPVLRVPTVNIGDRQRGRLRTASIIDCPAERLAISSAISRALVPTFRTQFPENLHPYGSGDACRNIVNELRKVKLSDLRMKAFYNL